MPPVPPRPACLVHTWQSRGETFRLIALVMHASTDYHIEIARTDLLGALQWASNRAVSSISTNPTDLQLLDAIAAIVDLVLMADPAKEAAFRLAGWQGIATEQAGAKAAREAANATAEDLMRALGVTKNPLTGAYVATATTATTITTGSGLILGPSVGDT